MMNKRIIHLINLELDAQISATKRARLYRHLEKSPEAQAYFSDLERLSSMLSHSEQAEPPASLKGRIMSAVRMSKRPARVKVSVVESILSRVSSPALPRYGFALISGICIGMLLFAVIVGGVDSGTHQEQVAGSMGAVSATPGTVTDFGLFESATGKASVQAATEGLQVFVEAEVQGTGSRDIALVFPSTEYTMVGIRRQAGHLPAIDSEKGRLSVRIEGSGRFVVELERLTASSSPVRLELRQAKKLLWEKTLKTGISD